LAKSRESFSVASGVGSTPSMKITPCFSRAVSASKTVDLEEGVAEGRASEGKKEEWVKEGSLDRVGSCQGDLL
jgi:hypothetical protein